jgi:hypothetical protein
MLVKIAKNEQGEEGKTYRSFARSFVPSFVVVVVVLVMLTSIKK